MGFLSGLTSWLNSPPPITEMERRFIGRAVETIDPMIKTISGYERKLAPAVRYALDYCESLTAAVPGPIDINFKAFSADPLVHAFFATPGDIGFMFGKSQELRDYIASSTNILADVFYALLGMRRREKSVMGMELHGDMIRSDVPQTVLYFADHVLREFADSPDETRRLLHRSAFESLVRGFSDKVMCMHQHRQQLRNDRDMARTQMGKNTEGLLGAGSDSHAQRREEIEMQLRQVAESLSPENILKDLSAWLAEPEPHLRIDPITVSVDQMGVLTDPSPDNPQVHTLNFPELIGRDRRHWILMIARIPKDEVLRAIDNQEQSSRYMII